MSQFEEQLVAAIHSIVREQPRWGYRRVHGQLRRQSWSVNHKRILRLWRQEGLKVPSKKRKRRASGSAVNGLGKLEATRPNQVWATDFLVDRDAHGKTLRWIVLVDEYTRECLQLEVGRSHKARDVRRLLMKTVSERGVVPEYVRSDNGPEYTALVMRKTMQSLGCNSAFIEPGSPWQNGYVESFNARFRDELVSTTLFWDLKEAKALTATWKEQYNLDRPHSALGYLAPAEFAERVTQESTETVRLA